MGLIDKIEENMIPITLLYKIGSRDQLITASCNFSKVREWTGKKV